MLASDRFYCRQVISLSYKPSSLSGIGTDKSTLRCSRDAADVYRPVPWPWKTYLFPVRFRRCSVYLQNFQDHVTQTVKLLLSRYTAIKIKKYSSTIFNSLTVPKNPEQCSWFFKTVQVSALVRNKRTMSRVKLCQTTNINFAIDNALNKKTQSTHVLLTRTRPHTLLVFV